MSSLKNSAELAAKAAVKEERARDAARAMREYEADRAATLAKTARLRAMRLAKESETAEAAPPVPMKKPAKAKR
jgi:hypothetical protein